MPRQVFFDKLVGIKYGTSQEESKPSNSSDTEDPPKPEAQAALTNGKDGGSPTPALSTDDTPATSSSPKPAPTSSPSSPAAATAATAAAAVTPSEPSVTPLKVTPTAAASETETPSTVDDEAAKEKAGSTASTACESMDVAEAAPATVTGVTPTTAASEEAEPAADAPMTTVASPGKAEQEAAEVGAGGAVDSDAGETAAPTEAGGPFRVSMRLSNEMPEFVVVTSKYDDAVAFNWRSEMHIQMAFMEEPGGNGCIIGTRHLGSRTGMVVIHPSCF